MTTATARVSRHGTAQPNHPGTPGRGNAPWPGHGGAPLLPALIFLIIVTQLPFVVTLIISFMNWNSLSPDKTGFAGFENYIAGPHRPLPAAGDLHHHRR